MRGIIISTIAVFVILASIIGPALGQCFNNVNTITTYNPSDPNFWDWKSPVWQTNIYSTLSGQVNSIVSPFYTIPSNLDNYSNPNIISFVQNASKDLQPEDGWELLVKNLGVSSSVPISDPYVIFYNKYTGKIRAFFLITQLFSETLNNDVAHGGLIKIHFADPNKSPFEAYQSNLLTSYSSPLLPLDRFKRDISLSTTNEFRNILPYWLYADFPVVYDPCTCSNSGTLTIETNLINSGKVDININSVPYASTVADGKVNRSTDFLQGFTDFSGKVEGGFKAAATASEALGKINEGIKKQTKFDIKTKLGNELPDISKTLNTVGSWASLIPEAGTAIKAVTSILDFFTGGGSSNVGPSAVMIMNDFKATGDITSISGKNVATFPLPGSDQSKKAVSGRPIYNNTLGVFNLLYTPKVKVKEWREDSDTFLWSCCNFEIFGICFSPNKNYHRQSKQRLYFSLTSDPNNLKFAINPALNIDLSKSDIRAAFVIENCSNLAGSSSTNLQKDIEKEGNPIFRSSYFPLGSLKDAQPNLFNQTEIDYGAYCSNGQAVSYYNVVGGNALCTPDVYIKIVARLHRAGTTKPSEDIVFIAKYKVDVQYETLSQEVTPLINLEDYAEDLTLPDNYQINDFENLKALNTIAVGNVVNPGNYPTTITAGSGVSLRYVAGAPNGSAIGPYTRLSVNPASIYTSSAPIQGFQATAADLNTFCSSSYYNGANNERNSTPVARQQANPKDTKILTRDEFFTFYPNPASNQVTFNYFLEDPTSVALGITDISGRSVATIVQQEQEMGDYSLTYDTSSLPPGVYIVSFQTNKISKTEKLVVIR